MDCFKIYAELYFIHILKITCQLHVTSVSFNLFEIIISIFDIIVYIAKYSELLT